MKSATKIIFASAFALSAVAPAFAYETMLEYVPNTQISTTAPLSQHVVGKRVRAQSALDARAYAPASAPVDEFRNFGIGSQS